MYRRYLGNFAATVNDTYTGETLAYTHDTLDETRKLKGIHVLRIPTHRNRNPLHAHHADHPLHGAR